MQDFSPEILLRLGPEQQEHVLQQALQTVPSVEAALAARQLVSQGGCLLVLLGQMLRARDICAQRVLKADLTDEGSVKKTLQIQGQATGIDLCIDMLFEIINFEPEKRDA